MNHNITFYRYGRLGERNRVPFVVEIRDGLIHQFGSGLLAHMADKEIQRRALAGGHPPSCGIFHRKERASSMVADPLVGGKILVMTKSGLITLLMIMSVAPGLEMLAASSMESLPVLLYHVVSQILLSMGQCRPSLMERHPPL